MARRCDLLGKSVMVGNNVSHANNKTKRRLIPNLRVYRMTLENGTRIKLKIAASTLRTIRKNTEKKKKEKS